MAPPAEPADGKLMIDHVRPETRCLIERDTRKWKRPVYKLYMATCGQDKAATEYRLNQITHALLVG